MVLFTSQETGAEFYSRSHRERKSAWACGGEFDAWLRVHTPGQRSNSAAALIKWRRSRSLLLGPVAPIPSVLWWTYSGLFPELLQRGPFFTSHRGSGVSKSLTAALCPEELEHNSVTGCVILKMLHLWHTARYIHLVCVFSYALVCFRVNLWIRHFVI